MHTQQWKQAELDGVLFCTMTKAANMVTDSSCIMQDYFDSVTRQTTRAYGRIVSMFEHTMHPGLAAPSGVVVECKWYELVGTNPVNGLPTVRYNPNWDAGRHVFLHTCVPASCAFWPKDPWTPLDDTSEFDVIRHHE